MRSISILKVIWVSVMVLCAGLVQKEYAVLASFCSFAAMVIALNELMIGEFKLQTRMRFLYLVTGVLSVVLLAGKVELGSSVLQGIKYIFVVILLDIICRDLKRGELVKGVVCAAVYFTSELVCITWLRQRLELGKMVMEFFVVLVFSLLLAKGIKTICEDYASVAVDSQNAICVFFISLIFLFGLPVHVYSVQIVQAVAVAWMLVSCWQFGFGVGTAYCLGTSLALSFRLGNEKYAAAWMLVCFVTQGVWEFSRHNKIVSALIFAAVYSAIGYYVYDILFEEDMVKSVSAATFFFAFIPDNFVFPIDKKIVMGEAGAESAEWGQLIIGRVNALAQAFRRIDYNFMSSAGTGIGFQDVGDIILDYTNVISNASPMRKTLENTIINELLSKGIMVKNIVMAKNAAGRYQVYVTAKTMRGKIATAEKIRRTVENYIGFPVSLANDSRLLVSRDYNMIVLQQSPMFKCETSVRKTSRYEGQRSGDNFYIGELSDGQLVCILADGMGNGENASEFSETIIDSLEELLQAGFDKKMSVKIVNLFLANKTKGESFSTLDMLVVDLHTGYGQFFKQGAATTFVKRDKWVEVIQSTSLPVGAIPDDSLEMADRKLYNGDIVIMVSDGVIESIAFENKEEYIRELILEAEDESAEDISSLLYEKILSGAGARKKDDATILVCKLVKTL